MTASKLTLNHLVIALTQHELIEDPHDPIAIQLRHAVAQISSGTLIFGSAYLIMHGLTKLVLVIGLLHGKLKNDEKERVMSDFKNKKYDILVSTTVVEVGVDVPNATVMLIENAERFGLSQLHQLRGRVGRSDLQSFCIISTATKSQETRARLDIMTQTNDGFVIAEKDLQIRGPGEFLGVRQSGLPDLIISDLVKDAKILEIVRNESIELVKCNDLDKYPLLKSATSVNMISNYDLINAG